MVIFPFRKIMQFIIFYEVKAWGEQPSVTLVPQTLNSRFVLNGGISVFNNVQALKKINKDTKK